jgi:hypothetical protein
MRSIGCTLFLAATITCAGERDPALVGAASDASQSAVLDDSEIAYVESGGIAGRVHEAHFKAAAGGVTVGYRSPDIRAPDGTPQAGTVDGEAYVALWRDVDRLNLWSVTSPPRSVGADLIQHELRIRSGKRSHLIRWDEGTAASTRIRDVAAWAQRVLAVAREYAANR